MPQVIVTPGARQGLFRCIRFLQQKDRYAAAQAAKAIERQFSLLETRPLIGRPVLARPDLRELVIAFGRSGFVALYRHDAPVDAVYVLAFRHQREAGC